MTDTLMETLAAKRAELEAEMSGLSAPSTDSADITFGKRVGDGTSLAVERLSQVAAYGRLETMLGAVVRAQGKLSEGSYGRCDRCGAAIPGERLEALPWATRCIGCAAAG